MIFKAFVNHRITRRPVHFFFFQRCMKVPVSPNRLYAHKGPLFLTLFFFFNILLILGCVGSQLWLGGTCAEVRELLVVAPGLF